MQRKGDCVVPNPTNTSTAQPLHLRSGTVVEMRLVGCEGRKSRMCVVRWSLRCVRDATSVSSQQHQHKDSTGGHANVDSEITIWSLPEEAAQGVNACGERESVSSRDEFLFGCLIPSG